jgi:hypothetical protein
LTLRKAVCIVACVVGKIRSEVLGRASSMAKSLFETGSCRGLCPFTGWLIVMVLFDVLPCIHLSLMASPDQQRFL